MRTDSPREIGLYLKAAGAALLVAALAAGYLAFARSPELQRMLRPAIVTLVGMIPMTFLFAHLGGAMTADEEPLRLLNLLALLGVAALIWTGWKLRRARRDRS